MSVEKLAISFLVGSLKIYSMTSPHLWCLLNFFFLVIYSLVYYNKPRYELTFILLGVSKVLRIYCLVSFNSYAGMAEVMEKPKRTFQSTQ